MGELFEFEELASKPSCVILSHLEWWVQVTFCEAYL